MSADNWTICPLCKRDVDRQREKRIKDAAEAYGKAPAEEYLELLKLSKEPISPPESLREDYDIGISADGRFSVNYRASCDCGFRFGYEHSEETRP